VQSAAGGTKTGWNENHGTTLSIHNNSDSTMKEKIITFFIDIVKEMAKVTWPKKDELRESTLVVIVVCLIIAAFIYLVDTAVSQILQYIL
jgi:preprotein translocase subunit SecE